MRTQLSHFCEQFVQALQPLLGPLERALASLERESAADTPGNGLRAGLVEVRGQLGLLSRKVKEQRAYVLIFGPLKSGKSTLMNSIAGSYVSEVSSLPAYPTLVFVSHGDETRYRLTDYEGRTEDHRTTASLGEHIDEAHRQLADSIRATEDDGEVFDPQVHLPSAIQRIDIELPAPKLRESGAVLVDTPGLYTRMRFGYDRMTRDFRNAAACAIFVVKSDTLFLEQVFAEFNELLDMFSRIFLVINMDTTKRDLTPDGRLVPSLEQKSPDRIVEAFEHLAMPRPLKEAAEEGRIRIFPVDLMQAASRALQGAAEVTPDFARFRDDLESYLASTEYLMAFLRDSLKHAEHLVADTVELSDGPFTQELRGEVESAKDRCGELQEELRLLDDCRKLDWGPAFERYHRELAEKLERTSQDVGARIARDMSAAIETWMLSSHSLRWLLDTVWQPLFKEYAQAMCDTAERAFAQSAYQDNAGVEFDSDLVHFLRSIGIDFRSLRHAAHEELSSQPVRAPEIPLDVDAIPIRRALVDVLAFRSEDKVRERVFGKDRSTKISARQKSSRLGNPAKRFLNQFLLTFREQFFPDAIARTHARYGPGLTGITVRRLHETLDAKRPAPATELTALRKRIAEIGAILAPVEEVHRAADTVSAGIASLSERFAATDADSILLPVPRQDRSSRSARRGSKRSRR